MEKRLKGLLWKPMWVSHIGCIKGCLDYLKAGVSDAWLFGATGHAFVINMHEVVCPSGPTAWKTEMLFKLGRNIGYETGGVFSLKSNDDFAHQQELAWDEAIRAIDQGIPCYGWELDIPEYYVVNGYDDVGYYYSGARADSGGGPKPWKELAKTEIGVLEMYTIKKVQPADDIKTVKESLEFALEHSKSPEKWIFPKYRAGLEGFDYWMNALESGEAHEFGNAYNSAVWAECRMHVVGFLKEAKGRVGGVAQSQFDEAIKHYDNITQNLKKVSETFPFPPQGGEVKDKTLVGKGMGYLKQAREAEEDGLNALREILDILQNR
jgi:hypothetical protein